MTAGIALQITHDGQTRNLREWCERLHLSQTTVSYRIRAGWPVEQALGLEPHMGNWKRRVKPAPPRPRPMAPRSVFELARGAA